MLTRLIQESIEDGYSEKYISLLTNYGLWARYFGAVGYLHPGLSSEPYIIDDDSALIVDRAMQKLKDSRPTVYNMMSMYYVRGLDEYDILSILKEKPYKLKKTRTEGVYIACPYDSAIRYLTGRAVRELIVLGERLVLGFLGGNNEKFHI